jgi:Icc-related predicted phosphoesterase
MIVDLISDLHGHYPELEGGDLLIVAGDLTRNDLPTSFGSFYKWIRKLDYKKKVFICGNHDNYLLDNPYYGIELDFLCDSGTEFEALKIWGTPWTSQFPGINPHCCAFTKPFMHSLKDKWALIPDDVDILITHTPPYGILDRVDRDGGTHVGDTDLLNELETRIKPKLHVFGHIHENGGQKIILKRAGIGTENHTICVNASIMNERYQPINQPVRVII